MRRNYFMKSISIILMLLAMMFSCTQVTDETTNEDNGNNSEKKESIVSYKVEHYQQNANDYGYTLVESDTENKTGTTNKNTSATAKTYTGFTAENVNQEKIMADGSTIVKIYYNRNIITLTLNLDGGDGDTTIVGKYGATVTAPTNPTKAGYTFAGWTPSLPETFPAVSTTYTTKWVANTYTVKFDANDGSGETKDQTFIYDTEYALNANAFTREDYTFTGWATTADGDITYADEQKVSNLTAEDKATVTLYAVWTIVYYTITYNLDGGANEPNNPVSYNVETETISLINPTKTGYKFAGWYTDETFSEENKITEITKGSTGDITLYAKWTANKLGITITLPSINDAEINLQHSTTENIVTFTANEDFSSYAWYIDSVKQNETSATFTIDTLTMNPANYKVMVIVFDRNKYYSATADLEIKN